MDKNTTEENVISYSVASKFLSITLYYYYIGIEKRTCEFTE